MMFDSRLVAARGLTLGTLRQALSSPTRLLLLMLLLNQ
jgi:hypothetical protein